MDHKNDIEWQQPDSQQWKANNSQDSQWQQPEWTANDSQKSQWPGTNAKPPLLGNEWETTAKNANNANNS